MAKEKKTTTSNQPWSALDPYLRDIFSQASTAAGATPKTPFAGPFVAGPTDRGRSALDQVFAASGGIGAGGEDVRNLGISTARGDFLRPESNPFLSSTIDAAVRPMRDSYNFDIMPGIEDAAISGGAYGGARQQLLKGRAAEDLTRNIGDVSGNIAFGNYSAERDRQFRAPELIGAADAFSMAGPTSALAAGDVEQNWAQQLINDALAGFQEKIQAPFRGISEFGNVLGLGGGYGTQTQTQPLDVPAQILQGLLGAGSMGLQAAQLFGNPFAKMGTGMMGAGAGGNWSGRLY